MLASSITRAGRRFATASASAIPQLRPTLPGAYREPTELWHHDKRAEAPSDVEVSVAAGSAQAASMVDVCLWDT